MRVLIVDDHPVVISGCKALLETDSSIEVREAPDGKIGYSVYFAFRPDVAVIDINLPGVSGLELCRRILLRDPDGRIAIFSMNHDAFFAARAISAGAKGYIGKNDDPKLFVEALRCIADGGVYLQPKIANDIAFDRTAAESGRLACLNARELEILRLFAAGHAVVEIADILHVSHKTASNNYTSLKQKLGARNTGEMIRIAVELQTGVKYVRAPRAATRSVRIPNAPGRTLEHALASFDARRQSDRHSVIKRYPLPRFSRLSACLKTFGEEVGQPQKSGKSAFQMSLKSSAMRINSAELRTPSFRFNAVQLFAVVLGEMFKTLAISATE